MAKQGRPGVTYESFIKAWEQLIEEGRAGTNAVQAMIGGSKSTISAFRERYEREQASKELAIIKSVKLTEAVQRAIAGIKVEEIEALEKNNAQLMARIDGTVASLKETEKELALARVDLEEASSNFDVERLSLERKLAAAEARVKDKETRENKLLEQQETLARDYHQAKQEAAVAKKEIEMLRDQLSEKQKVSL